MEANLGPAQEMEKDSLVKRVILAGMETKNLLKLSYIVGISAGITGRVTGEEWIRAIPPAMDLASGTMFIPEKAACYTAYGTGVATAYADRVYLAVADIVDRI